MVVANNLAAPFLPFLCFQLELSLVRCVLARALFTAPTSLVLALFQRRHSRYRFHEKESRSNEGPVLFTLN